MSPAIGNSKELTKSCSAEIDVIIDFLSSILAE